MEIWKLEHLLIFCILFWTKYVSNAYWLDIPDAGTIRKDFLLSQCDNLADVMGPFLACSKVGLNMTVVNKVDYANWCNTQWPIQRQCELDNVQVISQCLRKRVRIAVGYDFMTAFFVSSCQQNGELFADLAQLMTSMMNFRPYYCGNSWLWMYERSTSAYKSLQERMSCFDSLNIDRFNRTLEKISDCLVYQLHPCHTLEPGILFRRVMNAVEKSYVSSGPVVLNSDPKLRLRPDPISNVSSTSIYFTEVEPLSRFDRTTVTIIVVVSVVLFSFFVFMFTDGAGFIRKKIAEACKCKESNPTEQYHEMGE